MPLFTTGDDPGSSFPELLKRVGLHTAAPTGMSTAARTTRPFGSPAVHDEALLDIPAYLRRSKV